SPRWWCCRSWTAPARPARRRPGRTSRPSSTRSTCTGWTTMPTRPPSRDWLRWFRGRRASRKRATGAPAATWTGCRSIPGSASTCTSTRASAAPSTCTRWAPMAGPVARARMPTSGTGATEARTRGAAPAHGAGARGFTLLELLVVLAIVSVVAGMAVLATGGMGGRRLEHAARSTEALLAHACERAALTGRDVGIALVAGGLRFGYLAPQGFQPLRDDPADPLRPRMLDET